MTALARFTTLLLAPLLALAALAGCARAEPLVDVSVVDLDRGETMPRWPQRGKDYIEGRPGHRYAVVLQNLTGQRVLAVVSVDGVNAISGETAGTRQSGYVLDPWQRLEVRGWRKNLSEIAEFHFTSLGDSYAARTGRPGNVGVIGVAAFRERVPVPPPYPYPQIGYGERRDGAYPYEPYAGAGNAAEAARAPSPAAPPPAARAESSTSAADAAAPALGQSQRAPSYDDGLARRQQLGTGHGERRWDAATVTQFERASSRPNQVHTLYYDSWEALAAKGIVPRYTPPYPREPAAFPIGFAPDP